MQFLSESEGYVCPCCRNDVDELVRLQGRGNPARRQSVKRAGATRWPVIAGYGRGTGMKRLPISSTPSLSNSRRPLGEKR
jgi:hypothetical protein